MEKGELAYGFEPFEGVFGHTPLLDVLLEVTDEPREDVFKVFELGGHHLCWAARF